MRGQKRSRPARLSFNIWAAPNTTFGLLADLGEEFLIFDAQSPKGSLKTKKGEIRDALHRWNSDRCLPPVIAIGIVNGLRLLDVVAA